MLDHVESILQWNPRAAGALRNFAGAGRPLHAVLVEGVPGSGRTSFARRLAQAALCTAAEPDRPCGECRDCKKVLDAIHPDLLVYEGEGGARSFHIDKVRELRQRAYVRPNEGRYTVLLLEDVQHMSVQAQNALLKVLEEPPEGAIFLLTCDNRAALLDTILSRVTLVSLRTPEVAACAEILRGRNPELDGEAALEAARAARGSVGAALKLLEQEASGGTRTDAQTLLNYLLGDDEPGALELLRAYERDRPGMAAVLDQLGALVGERVLEKEASASARISRLQLLRILAIIDEGKAALLGNANGLLLGTALCARIRRVVEQV